MMNPSSSGWIKKFFSLAGSLEEKLVTFDLKLTPEEFIYRQLQPTGIMYGFPTNFIFLDNRIGEKWSGEEKFKVLLLEGLLVADCAYYGWFKEAENEKILERIVRFYEETEIGKARKKWHNFKQLDIYGKLESIIAQRVDIKMSFSNKLWTNYLHNSLIFQDIIMYYEFYNERLAEKIARKRRMVMLDMMKVVAVAAHADGEIVEEEEALFDLFMASAMLRDKDRKEAISFWEKQKSLTKIKFNYHMSWLLKRYFLEIATLMVWSDKVVVATEQKFLNDLGDRLGVEEEEQDKSFIAIQSFILKNEDAIPFLSSKTEIEHLMTTASDKWKKIIYRNRDKIATELKQSKELVQLIAKSASSELTKEEKKKVRNQFRELAKTVPAFALFMLPGGTIIMPLVLKLIPDLVPSAFRSNQIDESEKDPEKFN